MKISAFLLFAALTCWGAEVKLPPPFATPSSTNRPRVIPQPEGTQLHVPAGFATELFAEGFEQPRYMTLGPSNEILLSDSKGGAVYILKPTRKKLIEGLDRPYGSGHEIVSAGTRNPTAIHFYPGTNTLWASVQERDALGDDLVPDYFTAIQQGGFYGWPYAYAGPHEDPRRKDERPELVKKT